VATLVIGYGNPLRQDDGVGWHVAHDWSASADGDDLAVLACHQLTPELAEPISRADLVVFVDARQGSEPGRVEVCAVRPDADTAPAFSHHVEPGALLSLAHALYGAAPEAFVVSVDGAAFGHGPDLSPPVAAAVAIVQRRIRTLLAGRRAEAAPPGA
jgi:hydrogenase maturation protease